MRAVVSVIGVGFGESTRTGGVDSEVIDRVRTTVIIDGVDFDEENVSEAGVCGLNGLDGCTPCDENSGGNDMIPGWMGWSAMQEA